MGQALYDDVEVDETRQRRHARMTWWDSVKKNVNSLRLAQKDAQV